MARTPPLPLRSSLSSALSQGILALMRDEQLQAGDRLPSVRELSGRFGVAIPTLREAIRRLEAFGVVEVRHGSGIFVRSAQPPMMLANPHASTVDRKVILDLIEARMLFEPWCAGVAAQSPGSPGVAALRDILARAEAALEGDDAALERANMAFHREVAACAGNAVLSQVMALLTEIYSSEQSAMLTISNQRRQDHLEHCAVLEAIEQGDSALASQRMRDHLASVRATLANRLDDPVPPGSPLVNQSANTPGNDTKEVPPSD